MPKPRPAKPLSRDHRTVLVDLSRWLLSALEGFGDGLRALGLDPAPLAPITLALTSALAAFRRSSRVRDPASVALGDARAAVVTLDGELALRPCGHDHGDATASGPCEVATLRDLGELLGEALEASGEVLAYLQENPRNPILRADCVRALAGVQERAARIQAVGRAVRANLAAPHPPDAVEPN